jgi:hypothetical protein
METRVLIPGTTSSCRSSGGISNVAAVTETGMPRSRAPAPSAQERGAGARIFARPLWWPAFHFFATTLTVRVRENQPKHRQIRRVSRQLARKKATRAGLPAILIVCEGKETEPNYVYGLCDAHGINRANVTIVAGDGETDAVHLVQKARRRFEIDRDLQGRSRQGARTENQQLHDPHPGQSGHHGHPHIRRRIRALSAPEGGVRRGGWRCNCCRC